MAWKGSFFFQAEDGIRYMGVTGVQTCALPICIATGAGLLAALARGAEGVEMGTRFVATHEARAHPAYKAALAAAGPADTVVVKRSLGTPGRGLDGPQGRRLLAAEAAGAPEEGGPGLLGGAGPGAATGRGGLGGGQAWGGGGA